MARLYALLTINLPVEFPIQITFSSGSLELNGALLIILASMDYICILSFPFFINYFFHPHLLVGSSFQLSALSPNV